MATRPITRLTEEEYLALDRANEFRSEFVDREMLAMSGGTSRHSLLKGRLITDFNNKLAGQGCWVFDSDMRVRMAVSGSYVYPDMSVVCGKPLFHQDESDILTNPVLIAEVLSPSTESYDKDKKFDLYREIDSFREYLLVSTHSARVDHFSRQSDTSWVVREVSGLDASVTIPAFSLELSLAQLYTGVFELPR